MTKVKEDKLSKPAASGRSYKASKRETEVCLHISRICFLNDTIFCTSVLLKGVFSWNRFCQSPGIWLFIQSHSQSWSSQKITVL